MSTIVHSLPNRDKARSAAAEAATPASDGARGLAAMLLAAMVAALVVVADQMIDTWADGHVLAAWTVLWAIGFAAIGLCAGTARSLSGRIVRAADAWSQRLAARRADDRLWAIARQDARVMADLTAALARDDEAVSGLQARVAPVAVPAAPVSDAVVDLSHQPLSRTFLHYI